MSTKIVMRSQIHTMNRKNQNIANNKSSNGIPGCPFEITNEPAMLAVGWRL
jgi:hypothetical protein